MPIKVQCSCGKSFAARDELAGRTVKCPNCAQALTIPGGRTAAGQQPQQTGSQAASGLANLFAEEGLAARGGGEGPSCPSCNGPLHPQAIICTSCGYSLHQGKKLATASALDDLSEKAQAQKLLSKAAKEIEETPIEQSAAQYGTGADAYFVALGLLIGGGVLAAAAIIGLFYADKHLFPPGEEVSAFRSLGISFIGFGWLMFLLAWIEIVTRAFQEHPIHGVLCLVVPLVIIFPSLLLFGLLLATFTLAIGPSALLFDVFAFQAFPFFVLTNAFVFATIKSGMYMRGILTGIVAADLLFFGYFFRMIDATLGTKAPFMGVVYTISLLAPLVFAGNLVVWGWSRICGLAFEERENAALHGTLCLTVFPTVLPLYALVYAFIKRGPYIKHAGQIIGGYVTLVGTIIGLYSIASLQK